MNGAYNCLSNMQQDEENTIVVFSNGREGNKLN
jgi:hypothetical protein